MQEEKPARIITADFKDKNVIKFMRDAAALSKRNDVRSAFIMTVDSNGNVDWYQVVESEHHGCLIALAMDDAKADLKAEIFNEYLEE